MFHIIFNCIKGLEAKVVKLYEVARTTKESHIKGKKKLEDLKSSVDYITKKVDEYEEKEKQIKCLQDHVSFLENKNGETEQ